MLNRWLHRLTVTFSLVLCSSCDAIADPPTVTAKSVVAAGAEFQATDAESNGLTIRMDLDRVNDVPTIEYNKPFRVVLTNNSEQLLRICNPETQAGYFQLSLQFINPETGEKLIVRKRQIEDSMYWESVARYLELGRENIEIAPANSFTIEVRLNAFSWDKRTWTVLPDPNSSTRYLITPQFASSNAAVTNGQTTWIGKCESDALAVHFVAENLSTPNDYLRSGFPTAAIRLMKADSNLINATDGNSCTPLHTAANFGDVDAVRWLVDHGADVNAIATNGFTPLHLTDQLDVNELILRHKPDLAIKCRVFGQTPLQRVARKYAEARDVTQKRKWQGIVDLYLSTGAEYDPITAICRNDIDRLSAILRTSPQLADDFQNQSLLRLAASLGCLEACRYLTENFRVDVNDFKRGNGYPIIMEAVAFPEIMKLLIADGADLDTRITWRAGSSGVQLIGDDATILHYAANSGVPETINMLIDNGVDLFATDRDAFDENSKHTALEVTAIYGNAENAESIVKHPKFTAAPQEIRQSLLDKCLFMEASMSWDVRDSQRLKLIQVLVEAGANPNILKDGVTPMLAAASDIHPTSRVENAEINRIITYLIERGATVDFFSAVAIGDLDQMRHMLETNPGLASTRRPDGYPVLHLAVGMDNREIVSALLKAGCDVDIRNKSDHTGSEDETALHNAAFWGRAELAVLLIESGADVNAFDASHGTPLDEARRLKNTIVEDLLLKHGATAGTGR